MKKLLYLTAWLFLLSAYAQDNIRLNQLGYFPNSQKLAAIIDTDVATFQIIRAGQVVFEGSLSESNYWTQSKENVRIADFSALDTRGTYQLKLPSGELSYSFRISDDVIQPLSKGSIKAYYYNRASTALEDTYAGEHARPAGHPDTNVYVHPSAASENRPAGTIISTPKGWYDAGDYNKYIVNSGISVFTLLSAYENYPDYYDELELNIPESGDNVPDILDEVLWNLEWMATMQDEDGGVYNKTTHANFQGAVMPDKATAARYVVAKGTAATLDFAAVMAMASRVYADLLPDQSAEWLEQAKNAWVWAKNNPNIAYNNPSAQDGYPAVNTGGYGDGDFSDEFFWAASELAITTGESSYFDELNFSRNFGWPGWPNVEMLGILSLITHRKAVADQVDTTMVKEKLFGITNSLVSYQKNSSPYAIPNNNFYWGSNAIPGNHGMLLMQAYELTEEMDYFNAALSALDYLLGRNATGYSFVTGFGDHTPMNIHHRQSEADNIVDPVPGFLAGGPNPQNTDDCGQSAYPTTNAAQCYVDDWCSYSTNEITINWNAPLVYLSGALDHTYQTRFWTEGEEEVLSTQRNLVEIYPNPATENISIVGATGKDVKGQILSLSGKVLITFNGSEVEIDSLSSGTYIISIETSQIVSTQKLIVH